MMTFCAVAVRSDHRDRSTRWSAPFGRAGATAVISVSESTVKLGASIGSSDATPLARRSQCRKSPGRAGESRSGDRDRVPACDRAIIRRDRRHRRRQHEGDLVSGRGRTCALRRCHRDICGPGKVPVLAQGGGDLGVETTVKLSAGIEPKTGTGPKSTAVAPVNPDPVIVTEVLPTAAPVSGLTPVTTGAVAARACWPATT